MGHGPARGSSATSGPALADSRLRSWAVMGSRLYFAVSRGTAGSELWRSDGTTAGTTRVLDIVPGSKDHVASLTLVGDQLFFSARDTRGAELWASDGTRAGTRLVRDIDRTGSSYRHGLIAVGDRLFFSANDTAHGQRLWTSDGTRAGTLPLASVLLYWRYSEAALGDQLVFAGMVGGDDRYALWVSDGTPAGTHPLVDADVVADFRGSRDVRRPGLPRGRHPGQWQGALGDRRDAIGDGDARRSGHRYARLPARWR